MRTLSTDTRRVAGAVPVVLFAAVLTMASVLTASAQLTLQYEWTMETDPGWTYDPSLWAFGQPTGMGGEYGNPDPSSGYTGPNVCGYNLDGDYPNNMSNTEWLTTGAIDCSGLSVVELRFWRWLGVEQPSYDQARLEVSNDGGAEWTTIWSNPGSIDGEWAHQVYDISDLADGRPDVRVRWGMGPTDGSWQWCGWNIDDVEIWAFRPTPVEKRSWGQIKAIFR